MKFSTFNVDEINACSTKTLLTLYTFKNVQTTSVTSVIRNVPRQFPLWFSNERFALKWPLNQLITLQIIFSKLVINYHNRNNNAIVYFVIFATTNYFRIKRWRYENYCCYSFYSHEIRSESLSLFKWSSCQSAVLEMENRATLQRCYVSFFIPRIPLSRHLYLSLSCSLQDPALFN